MLIHKNIHQRYQNSNRNIKSSNVLNTTPSNRTGNGDFITKLPATTISGSSTFYLLVLLAVAAGYFIYDDSDLSRHLTCYCQLFATQLRSNQRKTSFFCLPSY